MTLKVQIYSASFNVTYPSQRRVTDLIEEFATMSKGEKKPGSARRFFVCIYSGADSFSNKMMLNQHRFIHGCPKARYPDGRMALLLPYPDLKSGEGKKVEVLSKKSGATKNDGPLHASNATLEDEGDDFDTMGDGNHSSGGSPTEAHVSPTSVEVPVDLIWKEVPPEVLAKGKRRMNDTRKQRKSVPKKLPPSGTSKQEAGKKKTKPPPKTPPKRDIAVQIRAVKDLQGQRNAGEDDGNAISPDGLRRSKRKADEGRGCDSVAGGTLNIISTDVVAKTGEFDAMDMEDNVFGSTDIDGPFHVSVRGQHGERPTKQLKFDNGTSQEVSLCISKEQRDNTERAISLLRDRFQLRLPRAPVSHSPRNRVWDGSNSRPAHVQCHSLKILHDDLSLPSCALNQTEILLPESPGNRVSSMVIWSGNWLDSPDLRAYWAEGLGSPGPFTFHADLLAKAEDRQEKFALLEKSHIQRHCKEAAEFDNDSPLLKKPTEPSMPPLYKMREFEGEVTLPWSWDCSSGDEFVAKWNAMVCTDQFKDCLMRVTYWWSRRKVRCS